MDIKKCLLRFASWFILIGIACISCQMPTEKGSTKDTGHNNQTSFWLRSPESIIGTIVNTWGIPMSEEKQFDLVYSVYANLGGLVNVSQAATTRYPDAAYVIAIDKIAAWVADQLIEKQAGPDVDEWYIFQGMNGPSGGDDPGAECYENPEEAFCPFADGLKLGDIAALQVNADGISQAMRKRMIHNILDMSDYLMLGFEIQLTGDSDNSLLESIYENAAEVTGNEEVWTIEDEKNFWKYTLYTMVITGDFFLEK